MRVLVTGAGGFLGQQIARRLLVRGTTSVRLHYRRDPGEALRRALRDEFPTADLELEVGNLADRGVCDAAVRGIDCVVHAAAGMRGAPADMFLNTVVTTRELLDACGRQSVRRAVLVSSFAAYKTADLPRGSVVDESTSTEANGTEKGVYAFVKVWQERLFDQACGRLGIDGAVLRPGVIYGSGGTAISPRVGLQAFVWLLSLGGSCVLPLTHVLNCADAVVVAALRAAPGSKYSVVDDDLPTCAEFLREYRRRVQRVPVLRVPYSALLYGSRCLERYHRRTRGQLPVVFTPYAVRSMYRGFEYSNFRLKALGWKPMIATEAGVREFLDTLALKSRAPE